MKSLQVRVKEQSGTNVYAPIGNGNEKLKTMFDRSGLQRCRLESQRIEIRFLCLSERVDAPLPGWPDKVSGMLFSHHAVRNVQPSLPDETELSLGTRKLRKLPFPHTERSELDPLTPVP